MNMEVMATLLYIYFTNENGVSLGSVVIGLSPQGNPCTTQQCSVSNQYYGKTLVTSFNDIAFFVSSLKGSMSGIPLSFNSAQDISKFGIAYAGGSTSMYKKIAII